MTLENYYYLSVSIAASLLCVILLFWTIISIWIALRMKYFFLKVDKITAATTDIAEHMKSFVAATTERISRVERIFLTAQGIKQVAGFIAEAIHTFKPKQEGDD